MRTNLAQLGLAAGMMITSAQAVSAQATDDPLLSTVEEVAALVGAPSIISTVVGETKQYYLDRTAVFGPDDRGGAVGGYGDG